MVIAIPIIVDFLKISLRFASGSDFYANDRFYREPALFRLDKIINCILNAMFSQSFCKVLVFISQTRHKPYSLDGKQFYS